MKKLQFKAEIQAPQKKVWDTLIGDATFRDWTSVFAKDSHFVGDWSEGSKIQFLGTDDQGKFGGMLARIAVNKPFEFISIEHLGMIQDGKEVTDTEEAKNWTPAFENYTLKQTGDSTELIVEIDSPEGYGDEFDGMFPKALARLKEIAES